MPPEFTNAPAETERLTRLDDVVRAVIVRRSAGERVDDRDIIETHPELMPELAEHLCELRQVEEAERQAQAVPENVAAAEDNERAAVSLPPDAFPGYQLLEELHRGGQGVVYLAVQRRTERSVAVKVMRDGPFAGPRGKARFEREIRILGQMQHPNIVTIHDSGTASGCHYLVMDYIAGESVDDYLASRELPLREALHLFVKICRAVHAAHVRGVIHRDLKPGNIYIDERGEPQILDFGLAKVEFDDIEDADQYRTMTTSGQFLGSLPWASPEQAEGRPDQIDLRTDIYSLGVILYHMLTGRFPYSVAGNIREIMTNIVEAEPAKPSSVAREVGEDLETILLKCLSKEPERRYQSAAQLAEDIERHLADQPILARTPSTMYQIKKLVMRHKLPVAFLAVLFLLVSGVAVWMSILYRHAEAERRRATVAEQQAEDQRMDAVREAETARAVTDFLVKDLLAAARPQIAQGRRITVEEVLANAADRVDQAFEDEPLIEASIREAIAQTYMSLGLYRDAEEHLRLAVETLTRELGTDERDTLSARTLLVELLTLQGDYTESEGLAAETLEAARRVLGDNDEVALSAAFEQAQLHWVLGRIAESQELHQHVLKRRRAILGEEHPDTLASLNQWSAETLLNRSRTPEAASELQHAIEVSRRVLGAAHPDTLKAIGNLGQVFLHQRKLAEGEKLLRQALDGQKLVLGEEHPDTLTSMVRLAQLLKERNRTDEAEVLYRDSIGIARRLLGVGHPLTQQASRLLGFALLRHGNNVEAAEVFQEVLEKEAGQRAADDVDDAQERDGLSFALARMGRYAEAEEGHRQALEVERRVLGDDHPNTLLSLRGLVHALAAQGKLEKAWPLAEELLALRQRVAERPGARGYELNCYARALLTIEPSDLRDPELGLEVALRAYAVSGDDYHYNRYILALAYEANDDLDSAVDMMRRALESAPIEVSVERNDYETALVRMFEERGETGAAEQVYRDTLTRRRDRFAEEAHPDIASSLEDLGRILMRHGKHGEAEAFLRECLELRAEAFHEEHWLIGHTMSLLGTDLLALGRLEEAGALLAEGYERIRVSLMAESEAAVSARARLEDYRALRKPSDGGLTAREAPPER